MMQVTQLLLLMVLLCVQFERTQQAHDINLGDLYKMQHGIGWPNSLHVMVGHEALLKLSSSFENVQNCEVTTPGGYAFDVRQPPHDRYESWGEGCAVRVKNVMTSDNGRWRLTAATGNDSITGWTEVYVEENVDQYPPTPITLQDGQSHASVDLTTLSSSYCVVAQPFSESSLVPGHCSVTLDRTTRAVQGNWHVLVGLPGRVSELQMDRGVVVESERLDVGFLNETSPNKLHLYCNVLHTAKNITFCRFQQSSARAGFNVMDGLSDGTHSYYGEGFAKRQCGMTIEFPSASNYGTWRCTVGLQERVANVIEQKTPLQALIRVVSSSARSQTINKIQKDGNGHRSIFVQENKSFTISCQADASLSYCWFQHPNGSQFTPVERANDDQLFWYTGESLQIGDCGITFANGYSTDAGLWTCHMGPRDVVGVELTESVSVRVTGALAAIEKEIIANIGLNVTLHCHTVNGHRPLDYCRFLTPNFVGINIDSTVTEDNAILGRFYFPPGKDLNYGDCSLSISNVLEEDVGTWTCAALVDDEPLENRDTIFVQIGAASASQYRAGVIGMSVGLSVLVVTLSGVLLWKYRAKTHLQPGRQSESGNRTDDAISMHSLSSMNNPEPNTARISVGSSDSSGELQQRPLP